MILKSNILAIVAVSAYANVFFPLTPALPMNPEEHPTSNIQRRTSNGSGNPRSLRRSKFDVGCSMFSLGSGVSTCEFSFRGNLSPQGGERGGSMGSLLSLLRTHWGHEPLRLTEARSGPRVCDPQPARFMESLGATEFSFREVEERRVQAARMLRCFRAHAG